MADLYGNPSAPPAASGLTDNVAGGLAYLTFIPALIFLFVEPYNRREFVRFHCFQSLFLTAVSIVIQIIQVLLLHLLGTVGALIGSVLSLILFVVWLIAIVQAFRGFKFVIPGIGPLAQQYAVKA